MMTRRFLLAAAGLSAAAAALPKAAIAAAPVAPPVAPPPPVPMWVVGTEGDANWRAIRAPTLQDAIAEWNDEEGWLPDCADWREEDYRCICGKCGSGAVGVRVEAMDNIEHPSPADWIRVGLNHTCVRCDEMYSEAFAVGEEAVCEECLDPDEKKALWPNAYGDNGDE